MIRLLLNCYTEREKLLLLEALGEAQSYLAKRRICPNGAPHLLDDLQNAILFAVDAHLDDIKARTLGIKPERKPAASLDDLMHPDEWAFFLRRLTEEDAALARELKDASPEELREQWGIE